MPGNVSVVGKLLEKILRGRICVHLERLANQGKSLWLCAGKIHSVD